MIIKNYREKLIASSYMNGKEKDFWIRQLAGNLKKSYFPCDTDPVKVKTDSREHMEFVFNPEISLELLKLANSSDGTLHIILLAVIILLLQQYTGSRDIIAGIPIYKEEDEEDLINTLLPIIYKYDPGDTFKELLIKMKETVTQADENKNYPVEILLENLNLSYSENDFPLFDVVMLLENIHDKRYLQPFTFNLVFAFSRNSNRIKCVIEYNASLYKKSTIKRIVNHTIFLAKKISSELDKKLSRIELLLPEERHKILTVFNDTKREFRGDKTVLDLFEDAVKTFPHHIAVVYEDYYLTYRELNRKANRAANLLIRKGVKNNQVAGIMMERSIDMIIAILAVIKARGAYLCIDPKYPANRINHILRDSDVKVLIVHGKIDKKRHQVDLMHIDLEDTSSLPCDNIKMKPAVDDYFYVIYTSGSTGKPKGVPIHYSGFANLVYAHRRLFKEDHSSRISQVASASFDAMAFETWPCLLNGAALYIAGDEVRMDPVKMKHWIIKKEITISFQPTAIAGQLLNEKWPAHGIALKVLRFAGEKFVGKLSNFYDFDIYNLYGTTEDTVWTTSIELKGNAENDNEYSIGNPIDNRQVYILNSHLALQPIGVPGELCVAGKGVANGYLNNPELTSERFVKNSFAGGYLYRTGDLARWQEDGNIEFLGRIDQQVKIRGYRIELKEIENCLRRHEKIKSAFVTISAERQKLAEGIDEEIGEEKHLCAYFVACKNVVHDSLPDKPDTADLREYLSGLLPEYMIPLYFVQLDSIPLTINGKVDVRALPAPKLAGEKDFKAPVGELEKKLAKIWAAVLSIDEKIISSDSNFFQLGGHSLKAAALTDAVHKNLDARLPLPQVFKTPTVKELSAYIKGMIKEGYLPVVPVEKKEYYPLSSAQKRMFLLKQIKGKDLSDNTSVVIKIEGDLDYKRFEKTLEEMIKRHEALRTSFHVLDDKIVQRIHNETHFKITYTEAKENEIDNVIEEFNLPFDLGKAPILRVLLAKIPGDKYISIFGMHHIITDGSSLRVLTNDFVALYEGSEIYRLKVQYKDFTSWQNRLLKSGMIKSQEEFWLNIFSDKVTPLDLPADFPRPPVQSFAGDSIVFQLSGELTEKMNQIALNYNASIFMLILAIFNILFAKYSSREDIVVGTPTAGRVHADFKNIVGFFVNTLAIRNYPSREKTFEEFLREVRANCLQAYENQDYQFEELVNKVCADRDTARNPLFDIMINVDLEERNIDRKIEGLAFERYPFEGKVTQADFMIHVIAGKPIVILWLFCTKLFKKETVEQMAQHLINIAHEVTGDLSIKISKIKMLSDKEREEFGVLSYTQKPDELSVEFDF